MSLRYLCDEQERHLPMAKRSKLWVLDGDEKIGMITAESDESADRNQALAIWKAGVLHSHFDPFDHIKEYGDHDDKSPHIKHDDDGYTTLVNPQSMTVGQARKWIKDNYRKARK